MKPMPSGAGVNIFNHHKMLPPTNVNLKRYLAGTREQHIEFCSTENFSWMFLFHKLKNLISFAPVPSCYAFMYVVCIGPTILRNTPPRIMFGSVGQPG